MKQNESGTVESDDIYGKFFYLGKSFYLHNLEVVVLTAMQGSQPLVVGLARMTFVGGLGEIGLIFTRIAPLSKSSVSSLPFAYKAMHNIKSPCKVAGVTNGFTIKAQSFTT